MMLRRIWITKFEEKAAHTIFSQRLVAQLSAFFDTVVTGGALPIETMRGLIRLTWKVIKTFSICANPPSIKSN